MAIHCAELLSDLFHRGIHTRFSNDLEVYMEFVVGTSCKMFMHCILDI